MSGLTLADILAALPGIKDAIDKAFAALEAASPAAAQATEEQIKAAIEAAFANLDVASIESSIAALGKAVAAGKSIAGGGADATLA